MQGQARTDEESLNKGRIRLPKMAKVKNKAPAPIQITAEQLLREAKERELELGKMRLGAPIFFVEFLNWYQI